MFAKLLPSDAILGMIEEPDWCQHPAMLQSTFISYQSDFWGWTDNQKDLNIGAMIFLSCVR